VTRLQDTQDGGGHRARHKPFPSCTSCASCQSFSGYSSPPLLLTMNGGRIGKRPCRFHKRNLASRPFPPLCVRYGVRWHDTAFTVCGADGYRLHPPRSLPAVRVADLPGLGTWGKMLAGRDRRDQMAGRAVPARRRGTLAAPRADRPAATRGAVRVAARESPSPRPPQAEARTQATPQAEIDMLSPEYRGACGPNTCSRSEGLTFDLTPSRP